MMISRLRWFIKYLGLHGKLHNRRHNKKCEDLDTMGI